MNSRDILLRALKNEYTPRPAWVPFVGVHGAHLIGKTSTEYLQSADLLVRGLKKAVELYKPDGLPLVFDLQMEAEILGCDLNWPDEGPPSVQSHPLEGGEKTIKDLPEFSTDTGRFPVVAEAMATLKKDIGDDVGLYGLICGPFTLALHLLGNDIFLEMFDDEAYVKSVVAYCAEVGKKTVDFYVQNGADVVAIVDPMTSQISPEHFTAFVTPYVNIIFDHIREQGALSSLFVCGDATRNLEKMAATRCDNISIDENIPLERLRDITRGENKSFGGNLRLTTVLLLGDEDDSKLDAIRCLDTGGNCGFVLAPGCDLPFGTPPANLQAVAQMVHDEYARQVAKRTIIAKTAGSAEEIELPDYANESPLYVDVITLDSSSCAPCQYMVDAVNRATKAVDHPLHVKEHRITTREGIAMMTRMGVANIPTICIDGEPVFISLIPDQKTLVAALNDRIAAKNV